MLHNHNHNLHSSRCAACKCLRRKCTLGCILAPHFPPSNPQRFASVHKIFGASNITKMLQQVPVHLRGQAAECIVFEAVMRMRDPVYGSAGIISQLYQQISQVQNEILKIQGEITLQNVHEQQHQQEAQTMMPSMNGGTDLEEGIGQFNDLDCDLINNHFSTDFEC